MGKESARNAGDTEDVSLIPGLGRFPGEGKSTHSSILAWEIPKRSLSGYKPKGPERVGHI